MKIAAQSPELQAAAASSVACPGCAVKIVSTSAARPSAPCTAATRSSVTAVAKGLTIRTARLTRRSLCLLLQIEGARRVDVRVDVVREGQPAEREAGDAVERGRRRER